MKKLLLIGTLVVFASTAALAFDRTPRFVVYPDATETTPFAQGDVLVPIANGQVEWYHQNRLVTVVNDPEGIVSLDKGFNSTTPLYVTDAEGAPLRGSVEGKTLFLSQDAPKIIFHKKDYVRPIDKAGNMTFHGGSVLTAAKTEAIFWGSSWSSASFAGDKITGLDSLFGGWSTSGMATTNTEYSGITSSTTYLGHVLDTSSNPPNGQISVSQAVSEACKMTGQAPDASAVYFIFTSTGAGNVGFCAWHSWGNCSNGRAVQVAYMPNVDGVSGCAVSESVTGHSAGLRAVANVTSHELSEAITDPRGGGWFDSTQAENGDKCAWSFANIGNGAAGVVRLANGSLWKLQMEWSNAAFSAGTGFTNLSGQHGCLQR